MTADEVLALGDLPSLHLNECGNRPPRVGAYADLHLGPKPHEQLIPPPVLTPEEEEAMKKRLAEFLGDGK